MIIEAGEHSDFAYEIASGRLEIFKVLDGGPTVLGHVDPGEFLGEMGLIDDSSRRASARAALLERLRIRIDPRRQHVIAPSTVNEQILGCVPLDAKREALEEFRASNIFRNISGHDAMQLQRFERVVDHRGHSLTHRARALIADVNGEA